MGLDPTLESTVFPFGGTDTVYGVTVSNIKVGASTISLSYNVTVFDPAVPGADYVPPTITGPSQPVANFGNAYSCLPVNNPNVTSYQWRTSQRVPGSLADNANNGVVNFTLTPPPNYVVLTNDPFGSATCFNLEHFDTNSSPQLFQLKEVLFPAATTMVSFQSELGFATPTEIARVQVSTDAGVSWQDLYTQAGNDSYEMSFTLHTLSLSNYAGMSTLLRFNYDIEPGQYDSGGFPLGWYFTDVLVTNTDQLLTPVTNSTPSTNFTFTPTQTGNYNLEARAVIFTEFPLDWGPIKQVTAVPAIVMSQPVLNGSQLRLDFTSAPASTGPFKLLQVSQLGTPWTTNTSATFTTNVPGSSYRFTTTNGPGARFYHIQALLGP
jgi:hypothetical protein